MNTIVAKKDSPFSEFTAGGTITPGMLVKLNSSNKVIAHNQAGGPVAKIFAIEDENQGGDLADNYAADALVKVWSPRPGDVVNAVVDDTTGNTIAIGDFLESAGDGRLRKVDTPLSSALAGEFPASIVGIALEAVASGTDVTTRFLVQIV